jgi:hypothetical protein
MINTGTIRKFECLWGKSPYSNKKARILTPYLETKNIGERRVRMFGSPKLIIAKLSKQLRASLDLHGDYASSNSVFIIDSNSPYSLTVLAAIMNSTLMDYVYRTTFSGLNLLGSFQFQAPQIRILPIPHLVSRELSKQIEAKVTEMINTGPETDLMKSLISDTDKLVYQAYNLSMADIETIETVIHHLSDPELSSESLIDSELNDL